MEFEINQRQRKRSTTRMAVTKQQIMNMDPDEIFDWDVEMLDAGLKELGITIGSTWSKPRKANELNKAMVQMNSDSKTKTPVQAQDPNYHMIKALQAMQEQMQQQTQALVAQLEAKSDAQAKALEAIAEKVSGNTDVNNAAGGNKKSHARGHRPEKLEREVDYASFLQWEKSWNLYVISDNLKSLTEQQQTAILFSFFSKELLSDLEYRFKVNIDVEKTVEEVMEAMKIHLKGQRSMVLARYNLFTRRQQHGETFEDYYCELRRLFDLAEARDMAGDDLLTVLITTGVRDEKVRSKILEDLKTPTLDDTVKLIEQMVYARDTNARIEKRREDSKIAAINSSNKRPSKTAYQKEKEVRRMDNGKKDERNRKVGTSQDKCYCCGRDRHPSTGVRFGWKENCPAKNATCKDCKKTGHFMNMPACLLKKINCIKIGSVNTTKSTNVVEIMATSPGKSVPIKLEADTGANITVMRAESLQEMDWVEISPTNMHIQGYSGIAEPCLGKANVTLQRGSRVHEEEIYFSNKTTANFLSRDACMSFGIIPTGFPHAEVNTVNMDKREDLAKFPNIPNICDQSNYHNKAAHRNRTYICDQSNYHNKAVHGNRTYNCDQSNYHNKAVHENFALRNGREVTSDISGRVRNRTYKIIMEDGKVTHRNRKWIRTKEVYPEFQNSTDTNQKSEQVKTYDDVPKYRRSKRIEARSKK